MSEVVKLRVEPGQEVLATLTQSCKDRGIRNGAVVSLVGAIDGCVISNMPSDDATSDILTEYSQPFELSGAGEISDGLVHLHVSLSGEGDVARHGHLHKAEVGAWYVAAYVVSLS